MTESSLYHDYPWLQPGKPIIVSAPMMNITMARLAVEVSAAGGIGWLAAGFDLSTLSKNLDEVAELVASHQLPRPDGVLPIGVGVQNWGADLQLAVDALEKNPVAGFWLFGAKQFSDMLPWARSIRKATNNKTKIWVQVGTVGEAVEAAKATHADVIVVQGADSGGHGLAHRAGIISLLPEVIDAFEEEGIKIPLIAGGGIADGRGVAAALTLGAQGVVLGTRFLACSDAIIKPGYQKEVLRATDGGAHTVSSKVYDVVREIHGWPDSYKARGVINRTYQDAQQGLSNEENVALYKEELEKGDEGWGPEGRMTTYAGTGIGLVREVKSARDIVEELQRDTIKVMHRSSGLYKA